MLTKVIIIDWIVLPILILGLSKMSWKEKVEMWLFLNGVVLGLFFTIGAAYFCYLWLAANGQAG